MLGRTSQWLTDWLTDCFLVEGLGEVGLETLGSTCHSSFMVCSAGMWWAQWPQPTYVPMLNFTAKDLCGIPGICFKTCSIHFYGHRFQTSPEFLKGVLMDSHGVNAWTLEAADESLWRRLWIEWECPCSLTCLWTWSPGVPCWRRCVSRGGLWGVITSVSLPHGCGSRCELPAVHLLHRHRLQTSEIKIKTKLTAFFYRPP